MHRIRIALALACLLSFSGFARAQEPQEEPKQPPEQTKPKPETAPPGQQNPQDAKPPRQEEPKPQKPGQEVPKPPKESKPADEQKGQAGQKGQTRPAGKSAHIPDPQFKASFGRQHTFKANQVIRQTTIVAGQTQFVSSGFTFIFLDPWPSDWLFTDDCYIDYVDDEYFLFDPFHPGIRVALFVVG